MVEEVCPYCETTVATDDVFCARCGESLVGYDDDTDDFEYDYVEPEPDPDRSVEADTADGDEEWLVYQPRARSERNQELKLLAAALAVTFVTGVLLGWAFGWWGRGGSNDDESDGRVDVSEAQAVQASEVEDEIPVSEAVGLDRLAGLAIAFRDPIGVHVLFGDGRDPIEVAVSPRAVILDGGSVALVGNDLFYIDGAQVRRSSLVSDEDTLVGPGDWVAAVPGQPERIWIVDRREDDETGSSTVLLLADQSGEVISEVVLPTGIRLAGATNRGVVVTDRSTGSRRVIGPDGFNAPVVPTGETEGIRSPDGLWFLRSEPGQIVARPANGEAADDFIVVLVPSEPAIGVDFAVAASG